MKLRISMAVLVFILSGCADSLTTPSIFDVMPSDFPGQDLQGQDVVNNEVVADPGQQDITTDLYNETVQPKDVDRDLVNTDIYKDVHKDIILHDADIIDIAKDVDIAKDNGTADIVPDVYKDVHKDIILHDADIIDIVKDIVPPDIYKDVYRDTTDVFDGKEDAYPVPMYRMFRMTSLNVEEPGFLYCLSPEGACMDITTTVNQMINRYIKGAVGTQPLDILLEFAHTPADYEVTIGNGTCVRQGTRIIGCDFMANGNQVTYRDVVFKGPMLNSVCLDDPQVIPTCFGTDEQDASIAIPGMQMVLGLRDAKVAAHFTKDNPFGNTDMQGYLLGFMPLKWARAIIIDYPGYFHGTMDQLLPKDKLTSYKGEKGWWFTFSFDAKPVPLSPYSL